MKFKGILLDIDNCLYLYEEAHRPALQEVLGIFSAQIKMDLPSLTTYYEKARDYIHQQLDGTAASHNRLLYFQRMFELIGINPGHLAWQGYQRYWNVYLDNMRISDGVIDFFKAAKKDKTRICFVTDLTADVQHQKIARFGLWEYVDMMVTSEEVGVEKPKAEIFETALKKIALRNTDVCMIGDDYRKDIQGAVAVGIAAFWINHHNTPQTTHPMITAVSSFKQILPLLR